jgi:drug/metabolite transporter (DMT)-like permease
MKHTLLCTLLALIGFAANSVLARLALSDGAIDPASFSAIRLASGIMVLLIILSVSSFTKTDKSNAVGSWKAAVYLFVYATAFSFAYLSLETATGALILFGAVQITMVIADVIKGNKLHWSEWSGLAIAFAGLLYLLLPSASAPSLTGFILMSLSGIAWGLYSLEGKKSTYPLADTAFNFLRTLPLVIGMLVVCSQHIHLTEQGVWLAILSGGIASGLGYVIWYKAVAGLTHTQAAVVQLLVPIIAAGGGVLFAQEVITWQLFIASVCVLGGILLVILGRKYISRIN